jgi:signal transduction histidine kinase
MLSSLRVKLLALFLFLFLAMGLLLIAGLVGMEQLSRAFVQLRSNALPITESLYRAALPLQDGRLAMDEALLQVTQPEAFDEVRNYESRLQRSMIQFEMYMKALAWGSESEVFRRTAGGLTHASWERAGLASTLVVPQAPAPIRRLASLAELYHAGFSNNARKALKAHRRMLNRMLDGRLDEAQAAQQDVTRYRTKSTAYAKIVTDLFDRIEAEVNAYVAQLAASLVRTKRFVQTLVTALSVLLLSFTMGLCLVFADQVLLKPIHALRQGAQAIGRGVLDIRLSLGSGDELGQLAQAFNRMAEGLERREAELRQADRMKTEILDVLSHEVRIPLATIQEGASLLRERSDALSVSDREDVLKTAGDDMERLSRLFDKVLLVTEIVTNQVTCAEAPIEVEPVVQALIERWQNNARTKGLTLQVTQSTGRLRCVADTKWIGRALDELVANAIQASPPEGRVMLTCTTGPGTVEVAIRDTGSGIAHEELSTLFERFRWVGDTSERKTGGFGLGLFIAKSLVEAQGGRLMVESAIGRGTTMTVSLKAV